MVSKLEAPWGSVRSTERREPPRREPPAGTTPEVEDDQELRVTLSVAARRLAAAPIPSAIASDSRAMPSAPSAPAAPDEADRSGPSTAAAYRETGRPPLGGHLDLRV